MVVTPGVARRQRVIVAVVRARALQAARMRVRERAHGGIETSLRQPLRLAAARAEAGPPQQAPGLLRPTLTVTTSCAQVLAQANNPSIANRFRLFETPTSSSSTGRPFVWPPGPGDTKVPGGYRQDRTEALVSVL